MGIGDYLCHLNGNLYQINLYRKWSVILNNMLPPTTKPKPGQSDGGENISKCSEENLSVSQTDRRVRRALQKQNILLVCYM